ncbi:hypothetical protein ACHAWF_018818 [Thalassiosira exigua]
MNVAHILSLPSSGLCLCCNLQLHKPYQAGVTMPPRDAHLINEASRAMEYSNESHDGTTRDYHQFRPCIDAKGNFSITWDPHNPHALGNNMYGHTGSSYHAQNGKPMPGKDAFLQKARDFKEQAEREVKQLEHAIPQWKEYQKQHTTALNGVQKSLQDLQARHRQVLQSKLAELGGAAPINVCPICRERQKEIAFQCGHQACTLCAGRISECHSCRVPIYQRIRLY